MRSQNLPPVWTFRVQIAAVLAGLLLSLLPQMVGANHIERTEQATDSSCARRHTIAAGETLSNIAENEGVSLSALAEANGITDYDQIFIGLQLCIPQAVEPVAPAIVTVAQDAPETPATPTQPTGTAADWTANYYAGQELSGTPLLTRKESVVQFDWEAGSPDATITVDSFSASWSASIFFASGTYRFSAAADDGVRIYVDGSLLLEDWNVHPLTTTVIDIELSEGSHTVQVEYFEAAGNASIVVWWEQLAQAGPAECPVSTDESLASGWSHSALGCPSADAQTVWSAWQPFERGHMLWRNSGALLVYENGGDWQSHVDDWDGQEYDSNRGSPPPGLRSPARGFGNLWENSDEVFSALGWATNEEKGFCARIQQFENGFLLRAEPEISCSPGQYNFASETAFVSDFLRVLDSGSWEIACRNETHGRFRTFWSHAILGCASSAGRVLWTSWQPFEYGHMIWRQNADAVFTYDNQGGWSRFPDEWDAQDLVGNRGTPPEGLQTPVRGFGFLWENDDDLFSELGWATEAERGICALIQEFENGTLFIGDSVDSCFEGAVNLASASPFANNAIRALHGGSWELVCQSRVHDRLDTLWDQSELGCPVSAGATLWSSWQPFQSGHMIWRHNDDAVFVFANGETWDRYSDNWDDQEYTSARGTPPTGLQAPIRGFGYLWEGNDQIFEEVGWATADERGFCAIFQQFEKGYLLVSDPIPSCLDGLENEATEIDFALHSLLALDSGSWALR